jgi:hypothetical protein
LSDPIYTPPAVNLRTKNIKTDKTGKLIPNKTGPEFEVPAEAGADDD